MPSSEAQQKQHVQVSITAARSLNGREGDRPRPVTHHKHVACQPYCMVGGIQNYFLCLMKLAHHLFYLPFLSTTPCFLFFQEFELNMILLVNFLFPFRQINQFFHLEFGVCNVSVEIKPFFILRRRQLLY